MINKLMNWFKRKLFEIAWQANPHPCSTLYKLHEHEIREVAEMLKKEEMKKEFDLEAAKRVKENLKDVSYETYNNRGLINDR